MPGARTRRRKRPPLRRYDSPGGGGYVVKLAGSRPGIPIQLRDPPGPEVRGLQPPYQVHLLLHCGGRRQHRIAPVLPHISHQPAANTNAIGLVIVLEVLIQALVVRVRTIYQHIAFNVRALLPCGRAGFPLWNSGRRIGGCRDRSGQDWGRSRCSNRNKRGRRRGCG
jgi:hypothetical protein